MSVFKRKTSSGTTEEYHYRFMKKGRLYFGVCVGCLDKESAEAYESGIRKTANELASQKNVKALIENFRDELSGGEQIALKDAFRVASMKPSRKTISEKSRHSKESRFNDFVLFMENIHPDVKNVKNVTAKYAEEYISYIRNNGRFSKLVVSATGNYQSNIKNLAPVTLNRHLEELRAVFDVLMKRCGMQENPFADIEPVLEDSETREAFSEKELEQILSKAPPFIRAIFIVGFFTAFREGDIATLKWSEVLWDQGIIRRKLLKTRNSSGAIVEVPIMPPLASFLKSQIGVDLEYVLPEHAKMYRENPSGIPYRVKKFLEEDLNICTTKRVPGRSRAISVKDVHSLRHTFCYFAGVAGIPLVVVQSIVGHMTPEMTAHYTAHADLKTKREKLALMPSFNALIAETRRTNLVEQTRWQIISVIKKADDETLNRVASMLLPPKVRKSLLRSTGLEKSK